MSTTRTTVAHVVWSLNVGGLENIVLRLVDRLDPTRFDSLVVCLEEAGGLAREGDRVVALHKKPGADWLLPLRIAPVLREHRVGVVHCHNYGPLLYGAVAARLARVRGVVHTLHGPGAPARKGQTAVQRLGLVDRVVAISDHVRARAIDDAGWDAARISTIHNGIDLGAYSATRARERMRRELGVESGDIVVGAVARLAPDKDHATLLDAFAEILSRHPSARLVLVGDGELREPLASRSKTLRIDSAVEFLGTRDDVADLLSAFDVFVLSSKREGLGITLIEAMAAGLPTVGTAVGGIPEVIVDGKTGTLVPPADEAALASAIAWMIENRDAARGMGEAGKRRARDEFSLDAMISRYEAVYDAVSS
jgi:sugar transferase (PEP-CTERM/EpsH1 system associated)